MSLVAHRYFRLPALVGLLAVIGSGLLASPAQAAAPSPGVQYNFAGTTTDSRGGSTLTLLPTCPDPFVGGVNTQCNTSTSFGANSSGNFLRWETVPRSTTGARGGGFSIETNAPLTPVYSMRVKFSFDEIASGYYKILDYTNRVSDNGFYFYNTRIDFYSDSGSDSGTDVYTSDEGVDLVITRNASDRFIVYARTAAGGLVQVFDYDDSAGDAIPIGAGTGSLVGFFLMTTQPPASSLQVGGCTRLKCGRDTR